jgi:hypothetical protein
VSSQKDDTHKSGREGSEEMNERLRKWAALAVVLMTMLAADVAFGNEYGPCYGAYLESGLTQQQMTFAQFRQFYGDTLCARGGDGSEAKREVLVPGETR